MHATWARDFAAEWARAWNAPDVDRVLADFHDDVVFTSPTAVRLTGMATLRGKTALRDYWNAAMQRIQALTFTVDRVIWDEASSELVIVYVSAIDGQRRRVSEHLTFDADGRAIRGEVFHGIDH